MNQTHDILKLVENKVLFFFIMPFKLLLTPKLYF